MQRVLQSRASVILTQSRTSGKLFGFGNTHHMAALQWPAWPLRPGGCTGTPVQSKGPGVWRRVKTGEVSAREKAYPEDKHGLGDTTPSDCLTKKLEQSQDLGWGMRVELSRGFGFELGAVEESICFMEIVLQKTTLRQLYPTSLPQINLVLICGERKY